MNNVKRMVLLLVLITGTAQCLAADVYLYMTRHGKTLFNEAHRVQGWADTPLTGAGKDVAIQLGKGLASVPLLSVWSSDSGRARETAQLVMAGRSERLPLHERQALREVFFGAFEGDLERNMLDAAANRANYASGDALMQGLMAGRFTLPQYITAIKAADPSGQAESYAQVTERVKRVVTEIARQAQQQGGGNVLIVSHGMTITCLAIALGAKAPSGPLGNASVTKIRYTDTGEFIVESINDMSYVQPAS